MRLLHTATHILASSPYTVKAGPPEGPRQLGEACHERKVTRTPLQEHEGL